MEQNASSACNCDLKANNLMSNRWKKKTFTIEKCKSNDY